MTEVGNLDELAAKIASGRFPNVAAYARAQAAASQSQETDIRKLREEIEVLKRSVSPPPDGGMPPPVTGPPVNTVAPTISGTTQQGQTLTGSTGAWGGSPTSYAFQWQRCDPNGLNCVAIAGATSPSYTLVLADVGSTVKVAVTATNAQGATTATSVKSATVASLSQPGGFASPLGYNNNRGPGFFPPSNVGEYGIVITSLLRPAAFRGVHLIYRSGITCGAGYTNFSEQECLANNWQMVGTNGAVLRNGQYGGVLADPGLAAYQQAWCTRTLQQLTELGADGIWIDDTTPRVTDFTGGVWPAKYPNMDAYKAALVSFASFVYAFFNSRGKKTAYNTGISLDDTGSLAAAWWPVIGPYTHYLTEEYWLNPGGGTLYRRAGPEWYNNWDGHRALHKVAQDAGAGFLPWTGGGGAQLRDYQLGTFMLDWNGTLAGGASAWIDTSDYNTTFDPWGTSYAQARALGLPTAAAVQIATNQWRRQYQYGRVDVNAGTATATFTVTG